MSSEEYSEDDFKYLRVGYINTDTHVDKIIEQVTDAIPGDGVLPARWRWGSLEKFDENHGHLGVILWSKAASYHLMLIAGNHVMRLWTDTPATCIVDLAQNVAAVLGSKGFTIEDIPLSCERKCKPLIKRVRIHTAEEADELISSVKQTYGV